MLLLQHGVIEETKLREIIENIKDDFYDYRGQPINDIFKALNKEARPLSFEVKSVVMKNNDGDFVYYHGIVNTEEDEVAKNFGGNFTANELKFFSVLVLKLIEMKRMVTDEIKTFKDECVKTGLVKDIETRYLREVLLDKLKDEKWLRFDDHNRWVVGIRSYLELKPWMEASITSQVEEDVNDEGQSNAEQKEIATSHIDSLPQIILY